MTQDDDPTDPAGVDPTVPGGAEPVPVGAVEARVRDALVARADAVDPGAPDTAALAAAFAEDDAVRRRRIRLVTGSAAAALLLIAAISAGALARDDDPDEVVTGSESSTADAGSTSTSSSTEGTGTSTATEVVVPTSSAPPATTTAVVPTTVVASPPTTVPPLPGASVEPRSGSGQGDVPALLTALRVGCNAGSDRVVFEFRDNALPAWQIHYTEPPITMDGSGAEVDVAGNAYLQVRLEGAAGHEPQGEQYVPTYTGPDRVSGGCPSVTEVVETGEFEAIYNWTVGVNTRTGFVVSTLTSPSRLVIDIAH